MIRDLAICIFSSLNLMIFSFIGFHYEAFKTIRNYQTSAHHEQYFDQLALRIIQDLSDPIHTAASTPAEPKTAFLSIPKLNIWAPINFPKASNKVNENLTQGVLSLANFISPDTGGQNIIFGHSSDYPWNENPFATVFTLLPELVPGDEITITRGEQNYSYKVRKTLVTDTALTNLLGKNRQHELILSTCYPIGFFHKRFNVIAEPTKNVKRKT